MGARNALGVLALSFAASAVAAVDKPGCKDHPLFPTRMPGFYLHDCQYREFDAYDFLVQKGPKHRVEGRFTYLIYRLQQGTPDQSGIAVVRNYESAITKIGGTIAASDQQRWVNGWDPLESTCRHASLSIL